MINGKILFIGCGHMGSALLDGWVNYSGVNKDEFIIAESAPGIIKILKKQGFKTITNLAKLPKSVQIKLAVLAVRPDSFAEVLPLLKDKLSPGAIVLSIAAGREISYIQKYLPGAAVIRAMPNMAVSQGLGVSGLIASKDISAEDKKYIFNLMSGCGLAFWLEREDDINKVIALSGSSPAYIYSAVLALEKAAEAYGFGQEITAQAAVNVFLGSAVLFAKGQGTLQDAVDKIATRGGTTEAAVKELNKNDSLVKLLKRAMGAAMKRSKEMTKEGK